MRNGRRLGGIGILMALTASVLACSRQAPSAPTPHQQPGPPAANQAPQITAAITPATGIDELTTFTARVEVKDPDGDRVSLTAFGLCGVYPKDTPLELTGGVAVITFKSTWRCGAFLRFTATDARGLSTATEASASNRGLGGPLRLALGEDFYAQPTFWTTLTQTGGAVTGTINDGWHRGEVDPREPGTVDEQGRFRVRYRLEGDPDDLIIAGELIAPRGSTMERNVIAVGQVVGQRHTGRAFRLWHEGSYSARPH